MDRIEDTLKLSPLFTTLSQKEKNELIQKLLSSLGYISEKSEDSHPGL